MDIWAFLRYVHRYGYKRASKNPPVWIPESSYKARSGISVYRVHRELTAAVATQEEAQVRDSETTDKTKCYVLQAVGEGGIFQGRFLAERKSTK